MIGHHIRACFLFCFSNVRCHNYSITIQFCCRKDVSATVFLPSSLMILNELKIHLPALVTATPAPLFPCKALHPALFFFRHSGGVRMFLTGSPALTLMYVLSCWPIAVAAKVQKKKDSLVFDERGEDGRRWCREEGLELEAMQYEAGGGEGNWSNRLHLSIFSCHRSWPILLGAC